MQPDARDCGYLWDMLDAALTIRRFATGLSLEDYLKDRKLQLAIERLLEVIGEAARGVSESLREEHPEIPWRGIIAQRNVVAHDYGDIKQERLWAVVSEHIPGLVEALEPLTPSPPED